MAHSKPLMAKSSGTDHAKSAVASALRTLDAEGSGITAISAALQSDLLIKGAYTQSPLRQMIFGGATRHILANASLPVLMAH